MKFLEVFGFFGLSSFQLMWKDELSMKIDFQFVHVITLDDIDSNELLSDSLIGIHSFMALF
jgi:hypothetical protein